MADLTLRAFARELGSRSPAPGGGAAVAVAAALAAACAEMVRAFTPEPLAEVPPGAAPALVERCLALADEDAAAFTAVGAAYALPREPAAARPQRRRAIDAALRAAAAVPMELAAVTLEVLRLAEAVARAGNPRVGSDAVVAAQLAEAALRGAATNVRVNLALIRDEAFRTEAEERLSALLAAGAGLRAAVEAVAAAR